ncbi:EamA family transporter [Plantactinospora veratri]
MTNATLARFVLLALLWGASFTFIKVSLEGLTPAQVVLSRLILGALVLLAIAAVRKVALPGVAWASGDTSRVRPCSATSSRSCCCPTASRAPARVSRAFWSAALRC